MEYIYANIYKRKTGELKMGLHSSREAADHNEKTRRVRSYESGGAKRVACIRINVETLCIEGRYDE